MLHRLLFLSALLLSASPSFARPGDRRAPPPEAIEACRGSAEGDACAFTSPHGEIVGQCRVPPGAEQMACVPDGPPPR